jgi:NAD(P)H-quinone oxidoreductase subunit 5
VYRISDAAMLSAAVLLHHVAGSGSLSLLFGRTAAAAGTGLSMTSATTIAVLLVVAAAGKSALLPFSGWLPRAMEGPTPSSAVYYGSLSIHAGCFLLLRAAPLLEQSTPARLLAGALGLATALFSTLVTRVQSDVKSSLAYALTQVGIIVVEIALGLYTIAFLHLAGHACFRLLQFLSAPNALHDLHGLESAAGEHHAAPALARIETIIPERAQRALYLFAVERGFLDAALDRAIVEPFHRVTSWMGRLDRFLCDFVIRQTPSMFVDTSDERDE